MVKLIVAIAKNIYMGLGLLLVVLIFITGCKSSQGQSHGALFVFGDSIFDPGNNNYINTTNRYKANYWPYGESYFNPPSGRITDGRIIPDFIAEFARLPLIPAYLDPHNYEFLYGANFASIGAGILVETKPTVAINLKTQLHYFTNLVKQYRKNLGDAKAEQLLSNAVYLFNCGANDIEVALNNQSNLYYEQYVGMMIRNLTNVFKVIHDEGGRKFGITTLTPFGCLPAFRAIQPGYTCDEQINILSRLHDNELSNKLQELAQELEGFMYAKYDRQIEVNKRMKKPSKYGFKVGENACCGSGIFRGINSCGGKKVTREFELCDNPNDYVLFDAYHPTEAANRQLAELFWSGDSKVTSPCNLKALFQGTCSGVNYDGALTSKHVADVGAILK